MTAPHSPGRPPSRPGASAQRTGPGDPSTGGRLTGADEPTTVLPEGGTGTSSVRRPGPARPTARPAPVGGRSAPVSEGPPRTTGKRRAKLAIQRIDLWSVFLYSLVSSLFLGIALIVAVAALYAVLDRLGVLDTVNELYVELTSGDAETSSPLFTAFRFVGGATVLAAVNVVLITLLSTLGALLYNLCASFTGGIEVTMGERD